MPDQTIDTYLDALKAALKGCDKALIQDAIWDAEDHLRSELARGRWKEPGLDEELGERNRQVPGQAGIAIGLATGEIGGDAKMRVKRAEDIAIDQRLEQEFHIGILDPAGIEQPAAEIVAEDAAAQFAQHLRPRRTDSQQRNEKSNRERTHPGFPRKEPSGKRGAPSTTAWPEGYRITDNPIDRNSRLKIERPPGGRWPFFSGRRLAMETEST